MDFLSGAVLSGIAYDMIKHGVILSVEDFKERLKDWIIDEQGLITIANELNKLELNADMSETAIERKIIASSELKLLLENIKPVSESNTIIQNHSGIGDIVGRDKIVHQGK
ncbi:MAG: hypothetical protein PHN45_06270 [Methylococcales bacterium]|nr:hypothetical protein [Methylococcales bacterium]